jgi:stage IV sporulation protein FB
VFVHWTTVAWPLGIVFLSLSARIPLLFLAGSPGALILVHELGHAALARRLGYRVHWILLSPVHGQCVYDAPRSRYDESYVAWGGVSAQLTLLIPAAAVWSLAGSALPNVLNLSLAVLTYYNAAIIILNLTPVAPFDGAAAWRLLRSRSGRAPRSKSRR